MRQLGTIINWNDKKRFGFIKPESGENNIFVHVTNFKDPLEKSPYGEKVTFEISEDKKGRPEAINVDFKSKLLKTNHKRTSFLILALFSLVILSLTYGTDYPPQVLYIYLVMSIVSCLAYAADKQAAKDKRWRVSDGQFHLVAIMGGWPGAIIAQHLFNHKKSKLRFRRWFWATVMLNCLVVAFTITPWGRPYLDTVATFIKDFFSF